MLNSIAEVRRNLRPLANADRFAHVDPLGGDRMSDTPVSTTLRGIARVALVAAETASRFQRDGIEPEEAMAWMTRPRALFGGRAALDACIELDDCVRGVLIHMLEVDPDADVDELDGIVAEGGSDLARSEEDDGASDGAPSARLFTCRVVAGGDDASFWSFDAFVAGCAADARRRLVDRHGEALAGEASISEAFDRDDPYVSALVSPRLADALDLAASDPGGPVACGLDVSVVQRFRS